MGFQRQTGRPEKLVGDAGLAPAGSWSQATRDAVFPYPQFGTGGIEPPPTGHLPATEGIRPRAVPTDVPLWKIGPRPWTCTRHLPDPNRVGRCLPLSRNEYWPAIRSFRPPSLYRAGDIVELRRTSFALFSERRKRMMVPSAGLEPAPFHDLNMAPLPEIGLRRLVPGEGIAPPSRGCEPRILLLN